MSFNVEEYNENINRQVEENSDPKTIRMDVPQYVYDILEESAQEWDTHKTNAFIRLVRTGDFLRAVEKSDSQIILRDQDGNESIISLGA